MKRIIILVGLCLCLNLYAEDIIIDYYKNTQQILDNDDNLIITIDGEINSGVHGILVYGDNNSIDIYGKLNANYTGIHASNLGADITIYSTGTIEGDMHGIIGTNMTGSIINSGDIYGTDNSYSGIDAKGMIGNISNLSEGTIRGTWAGIDAEGMVGDIYNYVSSTIGSSYDYDSISMHGIYAYAMTGNIENWGTISGLSTGINAYEMVGDITNNGNIIGSGSDGIYAEWMEGNITNNGNIIGVDYGIFAENMSGSIYNDSSITSKTGVGIFSEYMTGDIINTDLIYGGSVAIDSWYMKGDIINYGTINSSYDEDSKGIAATYMEGNIHNMAGAAIRGIDYAIDYGYGTGNIYNDGDIISSGRGIYATFMEGDIINGLTGIIYSKNYAISASNMSGDIINYGNISSNDGVAIYANLFSGDIVNYKTIFSGEDEAIETHSMSGDIINYGSIDSDDDAAIYLFGFLGTLYNYGSITSEVGVAISSNGNLNLVASGSGIDGEISSDDEDWLNITNDMDTLLDLSEAPLVGWSVINLLGGEMIITEVDSGEGITYINQGGNAYVHLSIQDSAVHYTLDSGILNPYDESSPFGYFYVNNFYAYSSNSTIEIDFSDDNHDFIDVRNNGIVSPDVTIKFIPQEIFEADWERLYHIFRGITVTDGVILEAPLLYTVEQVIVNDEQIQIREALPNFWVVISRTDETYSDYASHYNQGIAKFLDNVSSEEPEARENLVLALEQAITADELNALLEPYNMVGYTSLANNNINWINNRTGNLFKMLSNSIASEESASNSPVGSGYATANEIRRDLNGNNVWVELYMSDTTLDGKAGYELESDGYEVAFGFDKEINAQVILGLSLNISDFDSDVSGGLPVNVESDGFGINAYGQYNQGQINHKAVIGYTGYENEAKRAGDKADFDSNEFYAAYRIEYTIENKKCYTVPFAGLQYSHITYDDIIEDGSNNGINGYDYDSLQSELGVKFVKQFNATKFTVSGSWLHELMDTDSDATAVSDIGNYSQNSIERDEDLFRLGIGVDCKVSDRINLSLDYAKEFGSNTDSDSINAKISFSF